MADDQVREALAIAIVKERKKMTNEIARWKERATRAEERLKTVQGEPPSTFLNRLPQLEAIDSERAMDAAVSDVRSRRATLAVFLKNVHALRTAQVLSKSGKEIGEMSMWKLVSDFVTTSLVRLSPGKLRTAYAQHAAEYFTTIAYDPKTATQSDDDRGITHLIATTLDQLSKEGESAVDVGAVVEFLQGLLKLPCCTVSILQNVAEANLQRIQSLAQSAIHFRDTHPVNPSLTGRAYTRADLDVAQCETFLKQSSSVSTTIQGLFQLQEKALEQLVSLICRSTEPLPFSQDWIDPIVRSMLHAQQYVETLEIFLPDLAAALHLSTATLIAALQKIGSEEALPNDRGAYRSACAARSKSIRDFYMPLDWGPNQ